MGIKHAITGGMQAITTYTATSKYINSNSAINMAAMKTAYEYRAYTLRERKETFNRQTCPSKEACNPFLDRRIRGYTFDSMATNHAITKVHTVYGLEDVIKNICNMLLTVLQPLG
jgi:kynurenine formamidase